MLKALFPVAALAAALNISAAQAYDGPKPGDRALGYSVCNDVCDVTLHGHDEQLAACHGLCYDLENCRANYTQNEQNRRECETKANKKYALLLQGHSPRYAAKMSSGNKSVVTKAVNFESSFEEDNQKGFMDHD